MDFSLILSYFSFTDSITINGRGFVSMLYGGGGHIGYRTTFAEATQQCQHISKVVLTLRSEQERDDVLNWVQGRTYVYGCVVYLEYVSYVN